MNGRHEKVTQQLINRPLRVRGIKLLAVDTFSKRLKVNKNGMQYPPYLANTIYGFDSIIFKANRDLPSVYYFCAVVCVNTAS